MAYRLYVSCTMTLKHFPLLLLVICTLITACSDSSKDSKAQGDKRSEEQRTRPLVETIFPEFIGREYAVRSEGFLQAQIKASISPEISGTLLSRHPNAYAGGFIAEGETLFEIDPAIVLAEYKRADANVVSARTVLKKAKVNFQRYKTLADQQFVAESIKDDVRVRLSEANAALKTALANRSLAKERLSDSRIKAPYDLLVVSEAIEIGETVSPAQTLLTVIADAGAEVIAGLTRDEAAAVLLAQRKSDHNGLLVGIDSALLETPLVGRIESLIPAIDRTARTIDVRIKIPSIIDQETKQPIALDGDYVSIIIPARSKRDLFSLPLEAVRKNKYVYIVDNEQKLRRVPVDPLSQQSNRAIVALVYDSAGGSKDTLETFISTRDFMTSAVLTTRLNEEREGLAVKPKSSVNDTMISAVRLKSRGADVSAP